MKKLGIVLLFIFTISRISAQEISPYLIANNAWLPSFWGGQIDNLWDDMADGGFQLVRIGGNGANTDQAKYTLANIAALVLKIRSVGAEAMVQVPATFSAAQTTAMITYLNGTENGGRNLGLKYWAIGNEPNLNAAYSVANTAIYIRRIATALKAYDPTVKTMGPATAWYDTAYLNPLFVNKGADDVSGKDANGNYYIDILTWHKYAITNGAEYAGTMTSGAALVANQNLTRPDSLKMTWAITEFNGHYDNDAATADQKCWSFNTGQTFAEVFNLGMQKGAFAICGWSMNEGGGNRSKGDLGLFDSMGENYGSGYRGRSSYYHSYMLGRHMKSTYLTNADNQANITISAMGDAEGFSAMIINRSNTTAYDYSLALNGVYGTSKALTIRVSAGIDKEILGNIPKRTTQMLVFDATGNLTRKYVYDEAHALGYCGPIQTDYSTPDAVAGVLEFVSPSNGQIFRTIEKVTVEVNASHTSGIESVDLYKNNTLVGTLTEAPYTWDYTNPAFANLAAGFYDLKAVANIAGGGTITQTMAFGNRLSFAPEIPMVVPGKIEAELFDDMMGIQTGATTDIGGGLNVGWIETGDWLNYIVNVEEAGTYKVVFRLAGWTATGKVALRTAAGTNLTTAIVPNGGAAQYQKWYDVDGANTFTLSAGLQTIRIYAEGSPFNLNYFTISKVGAVSVEENSVQDLRLYPNPFKEILNIEGLEQVKNIQVFSHSGNLLYNFTNLDNFSKSLDLGQLEPGMYYIQLSTEKETITKKIVKE
jgi:hypothetical protein